MSNEFIVKNGLVSPNVQLTGSTSGTITITAPAVAGNTSITLPATAGTLVTTGDTGSVTNTMLAGSIANNKLANSTISGVALGSNLATLTMGVSGTGLSGSSSYNGSGAATFTVTSNATNLNTASAIVARDASGNFSAGTITASLTGNASTASALQTARTIALSGDVAGSVSFDGSGNATIATTIQADSVALGVDTTGNYMVNVTGGTGVTVSHTQGEASSASISIGQAVGTTDNVTFNNVTVNGTLTSDDITSTNISVAGNATITGNLTVSGTTTTINSTTIAVADLNLELARNATTAAAANGAGITVTGPATPATFTYTSSDDRWNLNKNLNVGTVYGNISGTAASETLATVTGRGATSSTQITLSGAGDNSTTYSSLRFAGYNQGGGTGFHGFFEVQNTYASATNGKKFFRLDSAGTIQIINSAYTQNIFDLTNSGALTIPSTFSASNFSGTHSGTSSGTNTGDQTITLTGDVTGGGTGTFATTLASTGVTAGTYNNVTVDAKGRVTSGSNTSYLTSYSETDTLASVTGRGASTSTASTFSGGLTASLGFTTSGGTVSTTYTSGTSRFADGTLHLMKTSAGGTFEAIRAINNDTTAGTTVRVLGAATSDPFNNANGGKVFIDAIRTSTNMDLAFSLNDVSGAAPVERVRFLGTGALAFNGSTSYGTSGQVLQSNGNASPTWVNLPTIGNGTFGVSIGSAGASNTTVTWGTSTGFSANTASNYTYDLKVGPALTNLATLMTSGSTGFIKRTGVDTYTIDTNTYLTSYSETDTLATVTGRGASTSTAITLNVGGNIVSTSTWEKWKLITTGTTAAARQGSDGNGLNFTTNALWNGSAWVEDDNTKKKFAYIQHLGNGRHEFRAAATGANIAWTTPLTIDETAVTTNTKLIVNAPSVSQSVSGVDVNITGSGTYQRGIRVLGSGMVATESLIGIQVGQADSNKNAGQFYFYYAGAASTSNRISMGLHSVDDVFNILGSGNVMIGTTTDSGHKLNISGTLNATGTITQNGTAVALAGHTHSYLSAESDTLATVTARGASTSTASTFSGGLTATGITVSKSGTDSTITFPAQTNDPGYIKHYESNNTAVMYFSVSDDAGANDYFSFGNTSSGYVEGFRLTASGVVSVGTWQGSSISTSYTDAKVTSISGSSPISVSPTTGAAVVSHSTSGVTAGTYNNVTVNTYGHVTSGSNASYLTSYTETDTLSSVTGRGFTTRTSSGTFATANQGTPGLEVYGGGGSEPAYMTFHRPSAYAVRLGLDGSDLKVGGWSMGAVAYKLWHEGNLTNLNQLTNGPGYITGNQNITLSGDVSGSGATSISVTVNQIDGWAFANGGSNWTVNANTLDQNGITYYGSGVDNFSGNSSDGALYSQAYSSSWQHQIAGDYREGNIAVRGKNSGTWSRWKPVPTITISDSAPANETRGDMWWQSSTGKLKIWYADGTSEQWVDAVPIPDTSTFFSKAGGGITGPVVISSSLQTTGLYTADAGIALTNQNLKLTQGDGTGLRVTTAYGYMNLGAQNSSWTHMYADRAFYTNQDWYVNGNVMLTAGNYNSYSPTLTGGNASGTWGISISGNAATASSVAWGNVSSRPTWMTASSLIATHSNANDWQNSGFYENAGAGSNWPNGSGTWYNSINVRHSNQGNYHGFQLAMSYYDNYLYWRSYQGSGTFQTWARGLSDQNYNSYSPTLTGGGASGTWGISVTGSAGSVAWGNVSGRPDLGLFSTNGGQDFLGRGKRCIVATTTDMILNYGADFTQVSVQSSLTATGNVTAYSDERVKTNWRDYSSTFVEDLSKVKHGTYDRVDCELTQDGVSAQSLQKVLPYSVIVDKEDKLSVNYGSAALVSSIELAKKVVEQEARIAQLEALIKKLIGE